MIDVYLITALGAWILYWVFSLVVGEAGVDMPGQWEGPVVSWGWLAAPLVLAVGVLHWVVGTVLGMDTTPVLRPGDHILYTMPKQSSLPGPRARNIHAHTHGEGYSYVVPKLWTVSHRRTDGTVVAVTPGGKRHELTADDPHLHKVGPLLGFAWQLRLGKQFPQVGEVGERAA